MPSANAKRGLRTSAPVQPGVDIRIAASLDATRAAPQASWIFCPAAAKFPACRSVWTSVLATHDSNADLLLSLSAARNLPSILYAGVFAVDPFRDSARLIRQLKDAGVAGVINFPSTSFIDGDAGVTLAQLQLGIDREIEFLSECAAAGLRTAGVAASLETAARLMEGGADFLVLHAGAPTRGDRQPERQLISKVRRLPKAKGLPLRSLSAIGGVHAEEHSAPLVTAQAIASSRPVISSSGRFLLGAAIGTGMAARAAQRGGADLLLALNAGRFRSMGAASAVCMLALRDANRMVMEFGTTEILPASRVPVFFGASALGDHNPASLLDQVVQAGFQGVVNFPSCLFLDGRYRQHLEEQGLGFEREVNLLKAGRKRGLLTLAYVRTLEEARIMARAGVDLVNIEFGWNMGGSVGVASALNLNDAAEHAGRIVKAVRKISPRTRCLIEGGPIVTPEQMDQVCGNAGADGYIGGSTIDRVPLEHAIELATNAFKTLGQLRRQVDSLEQQLRRKTGAEVLIGLGEGIRRARAAVAEAMQSDRPVLLFGEQGTGREEVARAIHEACVERSRRIVVVECRSDTQRALAVRLFGTPRSIGLLQAASGSTLVLDEVASLSHELQLQLLEECRKPGTAKAAARPARLIGMTRFDPSTDAQRFDAGLIRWLSTVRIDLPALRERLEDLPLLAERMLRTMDNRATLDPSCYRALLNHDWPGNLAELRTVLRKSAQSVRHRPISERDVVPLLKPAAPLDRPSFLSERDWIMEGLRRNRFRRQETARYLRLSRKTLYNKMLRYDLLTAAEAAGKRR